MAEDGGLEDPRSSGRGSSPSSSPSTARASWNARSASACRPDSVEGEHQEAVEALAQGRLAPTRQLELGAPGRRPAPTCRSASIRSSSTVHRSSSSRTASRRSTPSSSKPSEGRTTPEGERAAPCARRRPRRRPATRRSPAPAASASKQRASISSSGDVEAVPTGAPSPGCRSAGRGARRSFDTRACSGLAPPAGGSSPRARRPAGPPAPSHELARAARSSAGALLGPRMGTSTSPSATWSSPSIRNGTEGRYAHLPQRTCVRVRSAPDQERRQRRGPRWGHDHDHHHHHGAPAREPSPSLYGHHIEPRARQAASSSASRTSRWATCCSTTWGPSSSS